MLKRLELLGFKSFADKTAFEFGAGITCIVGPNGSGKSNVVDAIKWVLGEQSAKSLRGKEMADVIFNGSATRRSIGFAEATLVFDNTRRVLPVDVDEVQLTRRVYRSGEGEYLINKNPARLRDFRELFMGTGAGTEAYSVIEQGKVDVLLQSSTKDRRFIFEEAAGISRFKARKIEALRKLEHVDQNLLRLKDIVEEVEKQLRSVKLQAAKARRYKEHSERLRELRLKIGLADFHNFSTQFQEIEQKATQLAEEVSTHSSRCDAVDARHVQVQSLTEELDNQIRTHESALADCRQEIARLESQIGYERAHARDLTGQIERLRGQWAEFSSRVAELQKHITTITAEVNRVEEHCDASRAVVEAEADAVHQLRSEVESQQEQLAEAQTRLMDCTQAANDLHNELTSLESQDRTLKAQRQRLNSRCDSLAGPIGDLTAQLGALTAQESSTAHDRDAARLQLNQVDEQLEELWLSQQQLAGALAGLREERSAVAARIEVLADLEQRKEGVNSGVQDVLARPEFADNVVGLVADLLHVELTHAAWIERALGGRAQHIVIRRLAEAVEQIARFATRLQGSASFLALDCLPTPAFSPAADVNFAAASGGRQPPDAVNNREADNQGADAPRSPNRYSAGEAAGGDLSDQPGFVAVAVSLVRPAAGHESLAAHLLGKTIIVQDLQTALAISKLAPSGCRFVTVTGDILEADGTITTGEMHESAGLVSRKSQLRALRDEVQSLDGRIASSEEELEEHGRNQSRLKHDRTTLEIQLTAAADRAAQLGNQLSQRRQQIASLQEELNLQHSEVAAIDRDLADLAEQRTGIRGRIIATEEDRQSVEELIQELESQVERGLVDVEERQNELTASKIELAKTEGQLGGLRQRLASLTADMEDRRRVQQETQDQISSAADRERGCQRKILSASSQIAELFLRKERLSREIETLTGRRDDFRAQRHTLSADSQSGREKLQQLQAELHQRQLEASDIRHQRATLVERIREDYELDLGSLYTDYQPDPTLDRESIQQEIQELRRKIAGLGNVNLEALAELQELETRSTTLHAQISDLSQSKATLDEIIRKINQDSQRLFMETLEAIRSHFGELFRKLFGGGRADIVLENEADVLESGIEIVARPPGKELRSLSLLSGGEKTLTTVALLMAVFRSKPSPFCILDEVDAALDEANIERYTTLLREFASGAQFIMITHSKKSMVCADVLYGVTMQESGVSKRVSVRFEDVNEHGEISDAAFERAETPETPPMETPGGQEAA